MTPTPPSSPFHTPPQPNPRLAQAAFFQPVIRAQENLIFAIKNIPDDEFDRYLDQALRDGASLHSVDEEGLYPLELAVIAQRPRVVQSLLARNAPLPVVADDGFDMVMLSASWGHSALLSMLIDAGSMVSDAQDNQGLTPLHYAVIGGHLQAAIALLDRDADIDISTTDAIDRDTCEQHHLPPALAGSGSTPLMLAVSKGDLAMADLLLSRQADPTAGARHPLEIAIINNDAAMIDLFIQKGIDPASVRQRDGQSLLSFAFDQQCSLSLIKRIVEATMMKIPDYCSQQFLISMKASCPAGTSLASFMMKKLRERQGFPESLCEIISSAWTAADEAVDQWQLPGASADRINQCKAYHALHQMERVLFFRMITHQVEGSTPPAGSEWAYQTVAERSGPVNEFAQNPVIFLHGLEQPMGHSSLNDKQLTSAFCLATGLTPFKSRQIINAWRNTSEAAESLFADSDIEGRHLFSCTSLARALKSLLPPQHDPDGTLQPMPSRWETQLRHWCDVTLAATNDGATAAAEEADPEESRPLKRARYQ